MELGQSAGLVEVTEPAERVESAVVVLGGVGAVELLEGLPAGSEPGVGVEEGFEAGLVGVGKGVASAQQSESGSEHLGLERGFGAFRLAALDVTADLCEPGCEPPDHMEAVQDVAGVSEVRVDGAAVGLLSQDAIRQLSHFDRSHVALVAR